MVNAFEGNRGETTTMLPTIRAFMDATSWLMSRSWPTLA